MLKRQARVWVEGFGLGLYFIAPLTLFYSRRRVIRGQQTRWDEALHLQVIQRGTGWARHPLGYLLYVCLAGMVITLPNPLRALVPNPPADVPSAYSMSQTTSATWQNPVTGKIAKLVTGWESIEELNERGGHTYWFQKMGSNGIGMLEREFLQSPYPEFYTKIIKDTGKSIPATIPIPISGHPVCLRHVSSNDDAPAVNEFRELRVCILASGEIWRIHGWWPEGDEAEQLRVKYLMDGLESTID